MGVLADIVLSGEEKVMVAWSHENLDQLKTSIALVIHSLKLNYDSAYHVFQVSLETAGGEQCNYSHLMYRAN